MYKFTGRKKNSIAIIITPDDASVMTDWDFLLKDDYKWEGRYINLDEAYVIYKYCGQRPCPHNIFIRKEDYNEDLNFTEITNKVL